MERRGTGLKAPVQWALLCGLCGIGTAAAAHADAPAADSGVGGQVVQPMGQAGSTGDVSHDFDHAVAWLTTRAHQLIRDSQRTTTAHTNPPSIHAFPPQAGSGYEAFWLRDYEYMLEGSIDSFTNQELRDACLLFVNAQRADSAMVDCIKFDGTPIYMPGYGTMGQNPVADGSQFAVGVAWHTYQCLKDRALLERIIDPLVAAMECVPCNPQTHLVHIRPDVPWDRCPYGFTDSVRKQGDVLFCSLLYVQASRQLADLLEAVGRPGPAAAWRTTADAVTVSIRKTFWDAELGLFRAATVRCTQPDIWGSAFAVYLDVATPTQADRIAAYFVNHYGAICKRGQVRHTPGGVYWDQACAPETYQNGAYWGTPVGWFVYTLDRADPDLARRTVIDMVADYRAHGVWECINDGGYHNVANYVDSAALPLAGIRKMLERQSRPGP